MPRNPKWWHIVVAFILLLPFVCMANAQSVHTTRSVFDVGKSELLTPIEVEVESLCPLLRNEEYIVVIGHHDSREYPKNNGPNNYILSGDRAVVVAARLVACGIPADRVHIRGSWEAGDPRDTVGAESRGVTIMWRFIDEAEFNENEAEYQEKLDVFLSTWETWYKENTDSHQEILALLRTILEQTSWSQKTYELVENLDLTVEVNWPRWFIGTGVRTSQMFGDGLVVTVGREFLNQNLDFYIEGFVEEKNHKACLIWRPTPECQNHWGSWWTALGVVRPYVYKAGPVRFFAELGVGAAHVAYGNGPEGSIGWHQTGGLMVARIGAKAQWKRLDINVSAGDQVYIFPQRIMRDWTDGDFHRSSQASAGFTFHF